MTWIDRSDSLAKPSWTPAPAAISLIWTILYPVVVTCFGFVVVQASRRSVAAYDLTPSSPASRPTVFRVPRVLRA
jgi:tryptophan-rich sensory protein